jgi:RimJ/RimL family protein N-acetyltransferase
MELETPRLVLRQWKDQDYSKFADLNADTSVMEFFPKHLSRIESDNIANKFRALIDKHGWGFWAIELKKTGEFIGFTGLYAPKDILPFSPCVEIGWRLLKEFWGFGVAPEAAKEALQFAFSSLELNEVVSFATVNNLKSQSVMRKIGMENSNQNFMHPDIDPGSPLYEHVLFKISRSRWVELSL